VRALSAVDSVQRSCPRARRSPLQVQRAHPRSLAAPAPGRSEQKAVMQWAQASSQGGLAPLSSSDSGAGIWPQTPHPGSGKKAHSEAHCSADGPNDATPAPQGCLAAGQLAAPAMAAEDFFSLIAKREHLAVLAAINNGMSPEMQWQGALPLRAAVKTGDVSLFAILLLAGADIHRRSMEPGEAGLLMRSAYEEMHRVLPVPKHIPQHYPDEYKQPLQLMAEFMHDRPSARRYLWEHFGNVQIRGEGVRPDWQPRFSTRVRVIDSAREPLGEGRDGSPSGERGSRYVTS
jgi:hypothetical protein